VGKGTAWPDFLIGSRFYVNIRYSSVVLYIFALADRLGMICKYRMRSNETTQIQEPKRKKERRVLHETI